MISKRSSIAVLFVLVAALVGVVVWQSTAKHPTLPPLPNPNGYDDFVAAAKMVTGTAPEGDGVTSEEFKAYIEANADALNRARLGVSRECRSTWQTAPDVQAHVSNLGPLKRLGQALRVEGRLAELEKRPDRAATNYLTVVQYGHRVARGLLIDGLVGVAIEAIGLTALEKLTLQMDSATCRSTARLLETGFGRAPAFSDVLAEERLWRRHAPFPVKERIGMVFVRVFRPSMFRASEKSIKTKFDQVAVRRGSLLLNLARRAYELEKGMPPTSASQIVPEYLSALPVDPATGQPLKL